MKLKSIFSKLQPGLPGRGSIRAKLIGGFSVVLLLMIAMTAFSVWQVDQIEKAITEILDVKNVRESALVSMRASLNRKGASLRDLVMLTDSQTKQQEAALAIIKSSTEEYASAVEKIEKNLKQHGGNPGEKKALEEIASKYEEIEKMKEQMLAFQNDGYVGKARNLMIDKGAAAFVDLVSLISKATDQQADEATSDIKEIKDQAEKLLITMAGICSAGIVFGLIVALLITRQLVRAMGAEPAEVRAYADDVGNGKLYTHEKGAKAHPDSIMASVASMSERLKQIIGSVRESVDAVATTSEVINQSNTSLSARTEQQSSAITQTAAAMEELGTTVRQNTHNAQEADSLSSKAAEAANNGGEIVQSVVQTMHKINGGSRQMSEIVSLIENIAFQTNILALNAAVEAARAGEQGKGFAVVAAEVRNLAQRSAQSAKNIKDLINRNVEHIEEGVTLVDKAGAAMQEIVDSIAKVSHLMSEINHASQEQNRGVEQVGDAIRQLDLATRQNSEMAHESKRYAEELAENAEKMAKTVEIFQIQ